MHAHIRNLTPRFVSLACVIATVISIALGVTSVARASCNLIPQAVRTYDSALGSINRPFAAPNEFIEIRVRPCDTASSAPNGFTDPETDYIATVVFTPQGGTSNAVILSSSCVFFNPAIESACEASLGGGNAICQVVTPGPGEEISVVTRNSEQHLRLRFPDTDSMLGGGGDGGLVGAATIAITKTGDPLPCGLATAPCSSQTGLAACLDEFFTNDGACGTRVRAATFSHFVALPQPNDYVADCFAEAPPCNGNENELRAAADGDGNLLMPFNWTGILVRQAGVPAPRLVAATLALPFAVNLPGSSFVSSFTPEGGALPPIFEPQFDPTSPPGVTKLFGSADAPYTVLRLARRSETFQQCTGGFNDGGPCNSDSDCPGACANDATRRCSGDSDCNASTCGAGGTCGTAFCVGGGNNGQPCNTDGGCPGGECGPSVFPLTSAATFVDSGVGALRLPRFGPFTPVVDPGVCQLDLSLSCSVDNDCNAGMSAPCSRYAATAENPVPLEGLASSTDLLAFVINEALDGKDRNGDDDSVDFAVTLRNRETGAVESLLGTSGCAVDPDAKGRAVVRNRRTPFSFPAVAAEGDILAFLESEAGQSPDNMPCDENADYDGTDPILRVYELGAGEVTSASTAADGAPILDDRSIAVTGDRVFYRHSEPNQALRFTDRVSIATGGTQGDEDAGVEGVISADGRYVAFSSSATTLVAGDNNGLDDVFVRDRQTNTTTRVSVDSSGAEVNGASRSPRMSADGRYVAFQSHAEDLVPGDTNGWQDIFMRDRCESNGIAVPSCIVSTVRLSLGTEGQEPDDDSHVGHISNNGRYLVFFSFASNLVGPQNDAFNVYWRDRCVADGTPVPDCLPETYRVNSNAYPASTGNPIVSNDGRFILFETDTEFVFDDSNFANDIYLLDICVSHGVELSSECDGGFSRVSIASDGSQGNNGSFNGGMSDDARFIVFQGPSTNLAPGATNGSQHVYVRDRLKGTTELISKSSIGFQGNSDSINPRISRDGRFVVFASTSSDLVPNDGNAAFDVFVHDRATGITQRASTSSTGVEGNDQSGFFNEAASISDDGRTVAFTASPATTTLIVGDTNNQRDIYVRSVDSTNLANDVSGDGFLDDVILAVFDVGSGPPATSLCPSTDASVVGSGVTFLRPEAAGTTPSLPLCPAGSVVTGGISFNGDSDPKDLVVHYWPGSGVVQNLTRAATAVSLSGTCSGGNLHGRLCSRDIDCGGTACEPQFIAALVSEAAQNSTDLNNDDDASDFVVAVHDLSDPPSTWTNTKQAADTLDSRGGLIAFITPEVDQDKVLNGDGGAGDRVLQLYDAVAGKVINSKLAAEEFVMSTTPISCGNGALVAFRVDEHAQSSTVLNGDMDADDAVLHVYADGLGVVNVGHAVIPCALDACDPLEPYKVRGDQVKYLVLESQQSQDLNGDNDSADLILVIYDACKRTYQIVGPVDPGSTTNPIEDPPGEGEVFVSEGKRCMTELSNPPFCLTDSNCSDITPGSLCLMGDCFLPVLVPATCADDSECPSGTTCEDDTIVATNRTAPAHDSVVVARKALTVKIPSDEAGVNARLKVKVRNVDIVPEGEIPGHRIRLVAEDGTCPPGTVSGIPDLNRDIAGAQDNVMIAGGKLVTAVVPLQVTAAAFSSYNEKTPARCTLLMIASTVEAGNIDPSPRNNAVPVELNVIDAHDESSSPHESFIVSAQPLKITIGNDGTKTKTVKVRAGNGDLGELSHSVLVSVSDGDCPPGTVANPVIPMQDPEGGGTVKVEVEVTATSADFTTANKRSPSRCTAVITVTTDEIANVEPNTSNNRTELVVDVIDKADL